VEPEVGQVSRDFETLIRQIPAATVFWDTGQRRFTLVTDQVEDVIGVPAERLLAEPELWLAMIHPEDRERVTARYERAVAHDEVLDETYRLIRPDGRIRWVRNFMVAGAPGSGVREGMVFDVTDQASAQAERELLIDLLPAAVIRYDMQAGRLTYASPQLEELLGSPVGEWMTPGGLERFAERVVEGHTPHPRWRELAESGRTWSNELCWRRPDDRLLWLRVSTCATPDRVTLLQSVLQDATEEIQARRDREQLIEQMPGAITRFDIERREILFASEQVEALTGRPASWWIGAQGFARWSAGMIEPQQPDWVALGLAGESWTNQYRWLRPDGQERVFRSVNRVVRPGLIQSVVFDATEEVATERALAAEQTRYRTLIEQLPMVTFQSAPGGRMEYVSPQVTEMLGYSPEEVLERMNGPGWLELLHPADRAAAAASVNALERGERTSEELEVRFRARWGEYRHVLTRRAVVRTPGRAPYVHAVALDITDLRAAEARSRQALAALVRAGEDQQARLAVELHDDTVQALTAVLLQLERLDSRGDTTHRELVAMLQGVIERTRRLMFELRPQLLEQDGLQAMLAEIVRHGPWRSASVEVSVPRQSDVIEALAYRALRELVLNARKHSQADRLTVTGRARDGTLSFAVADDGVGFDARDALGQRPAGLHLGLSTVIERVKLAGGEVTIDSAPGAGTRVAFSLPAEPR
jgi:PAS domain S-box-containing protein